MLVGGIYEAIFRRIAAGRVADLPALVPDLIELTLLPYVGGGDGPPPARGRLTG